MASDDEAASPLMVVATFVLIASGVTALIFFAFVDTAPPWMSLQEVPEPRSFQVVDVHGRIEWSDVTVRLIDPAGFDQAQFFVVKPTAGAVTAGDRIELRHPPPGGTYLLRVYEDEREMARLLFTV